MTLLKTTAVLFMFVVGFREMMREEGNHLVMSVALVCGGLSGAALMMS